MQEFTETLGFMMEMCPDEKKRSPSHVIVIVVDNLNGAEANYESEEAKYKDVTKKTSFAKFMAADVEKQDAVNQLLEPLDSFKSVVYCQTAPGKHWGMPEAINEIADSIRMRARREHRHAGHHPLLEVDQGIHG